MVGNWHFWVLAAAHLFFGCFALVGRRAFGGVAGGVANIFAARDFARPPDQMAAVEPLDGVLFAHSMVAIRDLPADTFAASPR